MEFLKAGVVMWDEGRMDDEGKHPLVLIFRNLLFIFDVYGGPCPMSIFARPFAKFT
jgi:hypothetical protein